MTSILQPWVMELPIRAQGTLLTGVRNCDVSPKNPVCIDERYGCSTGEATADRQLTAYLRFCVLVPADHREVDMPGAWFRSTPPNDWKPSQFGHFPQHWYSHIMHCFQIVGEFHEIWTHRNSGLAIYKRLVHNLHLMPESRVTMLQRLTEDRIENGTVVS